MQILEKIVGLYSGLSNSESQMRSLTKQPLLLHFVNQSLLQDLKQPKHTNAYTEFNKAWTKESQHGTDSNSKSKKKNFEGEPHMVEEITNIKQCMDLFRRAEYDKNGDSDLIIQLMEDRPLV